MFTSCVIFNLFFYFSKGKWCWFCLNLKCHIYSSFIIYLNQDSLSLFSKWTCIAFGKGIIFFPQRMVSFNMNLYYICIWQHLLFPPKEWYHLLRIWGIYAFGEHRPFSSQRMLSFNVNMSYTCICIWIASALFHSKECYTLMWTCSVFEFEKHVLFPKE